MSRSEYTVPKWDLRGHQRQEEKVGAETDANRNSPDIHSHQKSFNHRVHMSNYNEIAELGWENGQPSTHEHVKVRTGDTLESIVNQATRHSQKPLPQNINLPETEHQHNHHLTNKNTIVTSSTRTWGENLSNIEMNPQVFTKKKGRSPEYYDHCGGLNNYNSSAQEHADMRSCASASAAFCRDNDTTMITCPSFESPRNVKTKPADEDSACHAATGNPDEEFEIKGEKVRSSKRTRTAAVHNQSERNRRDRINQKMKSLQKLVPNANKTDKASMLDEVIEHIKQLQTLIQMMGVRNMPQMTPLAMQQQLQMSLLAQMGMGVGLEMNMGSGTHMGSGMNMGPMFDMTTFLRAASQPLSPLIHPNPAAMVATPTFIPPQLMVPPMIPRNIQPQASAAQGATNTNPVPFSDPYSTFLAQSINMELYNKMEAAVHQQQVNQAAEPSGTLTSKHMQ